MNPFWEICSNCHHIKGLHIMTTDLILCNGASCNSRFLSSGEYLDPLKLKESSC